MSIDASPQTASAFGPHPEAQAATDSGPQSLLASLVEANLLDKSRWLRDPKDLGAAVANGNGRIQTINLTHLRLLHTDAEFRRATASADLLSADGWPIVMLVRRLLGIQVVRVTGSGFLVDLIADELHKVGQRVALVGATADAGTGLRERLQQSRRKLVYAEHGRWRDWQASAMARDIKTAGSDLVLVCVTPPAGEVYAASLSEHLGDTPVIGVGGGVDMVAGLVVQAPERWQRLGLEWVWRLLQEPTRMAKRYLLGDLPFFARDVVPLLSFPGRARRKAARLKAASPRPARTRSAQSAQSEAQFKAS